VTEASEVKQYHWGTSPAPELSFATQMSLRMAWEKDGEQLFKDEKTAPTMH
jgi:hypothetical protein